MKMKKLVLIDGNAIVHRAYHALPPFHTHKGLPTNAIYGFFAMAILITFINIILALFNLIPIPPLDGSKLLYLIFPYSMGGVMEFLERFGFILVLFVIFLIGPVFFSVVLNLYSFVVGF